MSRQITSAHFHKPKIIGDKYMLGDEIGRGAYGRVYKALDSENGDFVAIKQVSMKNILQGDPNSIMQEIDLLKILNHKNIVKYIGSFKTGMALHIILEYVENGSLANIIKPNKFGPFPESLVAVYISQVLEGLVYLHEQGVIHRDIKGANILTTKEGLVKLADFGVATKLNEADSNNAQFVVGTPYWMAPEVIKLSAVCAASDIWSVGCTVIELLTCAPPYYDLPPIPALYHIVQDENPPIPDSLSPDIADFLRQCFKKDARRRPDAKTLLSHPWIQNYRRAMQSSLRRRGPLRSAQDDMDIESSSTDDQFTSKSQAVEEVDGTASEHGLADDIDNHLPSEQVPTLAILEKQSLRCGYGRLTTNVPNNLEPQKLPRKGSYEEAFINGGIGTSESRGKDVAKDGGEGLKNGTIMSASVGPNELSRYSDTSGDASLDDLFQPIDKPVGHQTIEASPSVSSPCVNDSNGHATHTVKDDLATRLRATIAKKQMENEMVQANDGSNLLRIMMDALKDDVLDIDKSLVDVFDEKLPAEHFFPLQAVEFGRLVGSVRPEQPEDVIISACQKLIAIFHQRPDQKRVFVSQYGLLPLMELLEAPNLCNTKVICLVLQIINQIIKDNSDFQENACLIGLIPVVMSFAVPDRPREVRMDAAKFFQQLCQSSSLTLQMFIASHGIPVLVGFLEADYAKFREMVHLAIDGMWQVFKLQRSTPKNEFCRIATKHGILLRLINTLYSLNEAARLTSLSEGNGFSADGLSRKSRPGQLYPHHSIFGQIDATVSTVDLPDIFKLRHGGGDLHSTGTADPSYVSTSHSQGFNFSQYDPRYLSTDIDKPQSSNSLSDIPRSEIGQKQQRNSYSATRLSTERPLNAASNVFSCSTDQEQVRPLLSLLEKEPASRHFSGQLEYVCHLGLERHENFLSLHAADEKRSNGELDLLMVEFAEVSGHEEENGNHDSAPRTSVNAAQKRVATQTSEGAASTSGIASQTASGVLSGSGVLNARAGSATSSGLLLHMVSTMNADVAREYLEKVADLLLEFAQSDTTVKAHMSSQGLLVRLFQMLNRIERPILFKLLKCINHLSMDPNCLESLQRAEAIKHLIPNLELQEGPLISEIHLEVFNALFNLCKINKRRQEQAAENGIIPHLMHFVMADSPLKQYAVPLLCDMAHASRNSRERLRAHGGLDVYLRLLDDEFWSVTALDSIAVCIAHDNDNRKVEQVLVKKEAVQKLVNFFQCCPEQHFVHILEPLLKIITKSSRINTTLAMNGLTPLLIARLDHQNAIARLSLLKLIKSVYEHHPRPKQLIVENNLPPKLQNLIEERRDGQTAGGQVLVKQMATSILKALHINTVL